ncbi:hypothetical protein ACIBKY_09560 [Nonomuraea sp. NPDC050394]|uniref:hypothetical protein n=1 Tax=Nonomuraea sp. NPDC050394 TaxID=3364363 RepID=UPI003789C99D
MTDDLLLDAGLAPAGAEGGQPVRARAYAHAALGERPVIRLIGETTAPAEDRAMAFLGYGEPHVSPPLATGRRRGLGYPAWALVNDPRGAKAALAAVSGMERAARLAAARPGAAADAYAELAATLPRTHLPSFWEQAGRTFIAAGHGGQAAVMFGRAREAEATYALPVDEAARRAVFLEYAFAGALPVKAVNAYVVELAGRYEPRRAYDELFELAVRRTLGGLPPWSDLPKQLRKLAKAAKLDPAAEDERLIATLLGAPAVKRARPPFWKAYRATLLAQPRQTLLEVFPTADGVDEWWLELLRESGALDTVPAAWLSRMVAHLKRGWRSEPGSPALLALVERIAGRLAAEGEPVRLEGGVAWRTRMLDLDLLDACLAAGVPVADPGSESVVHLGRWLMNGRIRDLAAVAADPRFAPLLEQAVGSHREAEELIEIPVLRPMVHAWLLDRTRQAATGGLLDARSALGALENALTGPVLAAFDGLREAIEGIDFAVPLCRTLRAGVYDELGWDAFDAALEELGEDARVSASWPVLTVFTAAKAIALGPGGRVAEHDLRVPAGTPHLDVLYAGGAFRVAWGTNESRSFYWSSAPSEIHEKDGWHYFHEHRAGLGYAFLTPSGGRVTGRKALHPGDRRPELDETGRMFSDGATFWIQPDAWRPVLRELDPAAGQLGRASLPAFLEDAPPPPGARWQLDGCSLAPLPEGLERTPLGTADGMIGFRVHAAGGHYTYARADGRGGGAKLTATPWGLLDLPGRAEPLLLTGTGTTVVLAEADGALHWDVTTGRDRWSTAKGSSDGTALVPFQAFWHHLAPRDPGGSAVLRNLTEAGARALMDGGAPPVTHERLRRGVAGLVRQANELATRRDELLASAGATAGLVPGLDEEELAKALADLVNAQGLLTYQAGRQIAFTVAFLSGEVPPEAVKGAMPGSFHDWTDLIGRLGGLAVRAISPATPAPRRAAILALLELWSGSRLAEPGLRRGVADAPGPTGHLSAEGAHLTLDVTPNWPGIYQARRRRFIEYGTAPRAGEVLDVSAELPTGWATPRTLAAFVDRLRERGPAEHDPEAVELLCAETGLGRPAAALLLAGLPGLDSWGRDFLPAESREVLGLKPAEAVVARDELKPLTRQERRDLLDAAVPADPWDQKALARGLAEAWTARFGRRPRVPEDAVTAARTLPLRLPAARALGALTDPSSVAELNRDHDTWLAGNRYHEAVEPVSLDDLLADLALALPWAYATLPGGHPVRAGLPAALDLVRRRLNHPGLLLRGGPMEADGFTGEPYRGKLDDEVTAVDDGLTIVVTHGQTFFRPALLGGDARSRLQLSLETPWDTRTPPARVVELLRSDGYTRMAERTPLLEAGRWEADPRASAPAVLAAAADTLSLDEDPAVLYLQLLTLLEPTDRNVRTWNDWTPARHKKAAAVLSERGLVMAAKRERAGRGLFLPGGWTKGKAPDLPAETWKLEALYPLTLGRRLPETSLPELFERAWQRVREGQGPR